MKKDFSNSDLLKQELSKGNEQALVFLMDTYHRPLCLYVYSLYNDYDGAKDIVQKTFIKIWEHRDRMGSVRSIKGFLYKSVYNEFIDQYRKRSRIPILEKKYVEAVDHIVKNEDQALLQQQIKWVDQEIQRLPAKCKKTFLLSKREGLTNMEIAEYMDVSIKTVETQITKAFRILRSKLADKTKTLFFLLFRLYGQPYKF